MWDELPNEIVRMIWHQRSLLMADSFLARESVRRTAFGSEHLKHIHWAYTLTRPRYDDIIQSMLYDHDMWVHYYH